MLVAVADQLSGELGYTGGERLVGASSGLRGNGAISGVLAPEDEDLMAALREALAKIAAAIGGEEHGSRDHGATSATLDGIEMVIRGELLRGNASRLPELLPSFVFLVALPVGEQDEAIALSQKAAKLVEQQSTSSPERDSNY